MNAIEAPDKTAWNKAKAARLLGMDRVTLYRKIESYNLTEDTPDVEVLLVTWKICNASVACNAISIQVRLLGRYSLLP